MMIQKTDVRVIDTPAGDLEAWAEVSEGDPTNIRAAHNHKDAVQLDVLHMEKKTVGIMAEASLAVIARVDMVNQAAAVKADMVVQSIQDADVNPDLKIQTSAMTGTRTIMEQVVNLDNHGITEAEAAQVAIPVVATRVNITVKEGGGAVMMMTASKTHPTMILIGIGMKAVHLHAVGAVALQVVASQEIAEAETVAAVEMVGAVLPETVPPGAAGNV